MGESRTVPPNFFVNPVSSSGNGGSASWGSVSGTLSSQTDLQAALDLKFSLSDWYATTTPIANGGTGITTAPTYGQVLVGNTLGGYTLMATSSLGITGGGGSSQWTDVTGGINYSGGNVGIGTSSPTRMLSVSDDGTYSAYFSGRVGIGISSPGYALHVNGNTMAGGVLYSTGSFRKVGADAIGTPGFTWDSDSNTGLFNPTTDVLGITTGGAERMRVDANGNVGIGTSSPSTKLHVSGTGTVKTRVESTDNTSAYYELVRPGATSWRVGNDGNFRIDTSTNSFSTVASTPFYINPSGNVGVGTTSPYGTLSIQGSADQPQLVVKAHTTQNTSLVEFKNGTGSTVAAINSAGVGIFSTIQIGGYQALSRTGTSLEINNSNAATNNNLQFYTNSGGTAFERMRIDTSGNIGIGTTTPNTILSILSATTPQFRVSYDSTNSATLAVNSSGTLTLAPSGLNTSVSGSLAVTSGLNVTGALGNGNYLQVNGTSGLIYNGTNVGIGTSSPYAKLSVAGQVVADNIWATSTTASNYFAGNVGIGTTSPMGKLAIQSGQIVAAVGSAAAPAYTFNDGLGTGWFSNGGGSIGFSFNGTERFRVGAAGSGAAVVTSQPSNTFAIGIAPSNSMTSDVTLYRDAADSLALRRTTNAQSLKVYNTFTDAGNYERGGINWASNTLQFGTENSGTGSARSLAFLTASTTRMTIDSTGNVGIGTTSPSVVLDIKKSFATANDQQVLVRLFRDSDSGTGQTGIGSLMQFDVRDSGGSARTVGQFGGLLSSSNDSSGFIINTNSVQRMIVGLSGNVGIGTSSPYSKLSVVGQVVASNYVATSTNATSTFAYDLSVNGRLRVLQNTTNAVIMGDTSGLARGSYAVDIQSYRSSDDRIASGQYSLALGFDNISDQLSATALGYNNSATGLQSTAIGYQNTASGLNTFALGLSNNVSASGAFAIGNGITNSIANSLQIGPSNTAKLTILSTGNVGVGTTSPYAKLSVAGLIVASNISATSTTATSTFMGALGVGTASPDGNVQMHIRRDISGAVANTLRLTNGGAGDGTGASLGFSYANSAHSPAFISSPYVNGSTLAFGTIDIPNGNDGLVRMVISALGKVGIGHTLPTMPTNKLEVVGNMSIGTNYSNGATAAPTNGLIIEGNVGIGTSSPSQKLVVQGGLCVTAGAACTSETAGTIVADGVITQNAFDLAESYATTDTTIEAGDVVAADPSTPLYIVKASSTSAVIGIISTKPGFTLGDSRKGKPVALAGRVPVKFSTENGEVKIGDSLTVSDTKVGFAMKAKAGSVIIGTALENQNTEGTVTVFVRSHLAQGIQMGDVTAELAKSKATLLSEFLSFVSAPSTWMQARVSAATGMFKNLFVKDLTAEKATVGSSEMPTGITLFDETTHAPYCLKISNGAVVTVPGECGTTQPAAVTPTPTSTPAPTPTPEPAPVATSTEPVIEESEPVVEEETVVQEEEILPVEETPVVEIPAEQAPLTETQN
jgi:hypothetical protein